jgi:fatty-acyl-CoA synthase
MTLQATVAAPSTRSNKMSVNKSWLRALELTSRLGTFPERILPALIDELAEGFGDAPALLSDRESFSYSQLAERANRYARWALDQGLHPGDVIGLLMPNRPEYIAIWLGITRAGGVVALLNTNLTRESLAHCIMLAQPKHLIVAADLIDSFASASDFLATRPKVWVHGISASTMPRIDDAVELYPGNSLGPRERRHITLSDKALYIYTSGTTGLPKAANVSHHRLMSWSHWFAGMMDIGRGDRMYDCLPMYHSVGGVAAPAAMLVSGGSVVVSERFSASRFWDEIARWDCTLFQYIGELCRYLVNAPPGDSEIRHRLRLACGNGLQKDIWTRFQNRFRIPHILEFYAGTEHNFSLFNVEAKPGAIGRIPNFLRHRFPAALIELDPDTGEPTRSERGFCGRCSPGEVGEAIGRISTDRASHFEGYLGSAENQRKLIRDVFEEGDVWLRTGDLMRMDDKGYFYFVDRLGDTFRWKGENVASSEVSAAISECPGVLDVCVYGVTVSGHEGRTGMAALAIDRSFAVDDFYQHLAERLPDYAHPRFIRIVAEFSATETFKKKKRELMRDGFDPSVVFDALYVRHVEKKTFVPIDETALEAIEAGRMRL